MTTIAIERSQSSLFSKVSLLLSGSFIISSIGTYAGAGITSTAAMVVLLILFLAGAFVVPLAVRASATAGVTALIVWTFISGLFLGPAINFYAANLGWETVFLAYLGTAGVMALCGAVGVFSGFNFSGLGRWLFFALLALIVVGIVAIFVPFSHTVNIVWSLIGMGVFALFFIFDFFRAKDAPNTWESAVFVTMSLHLDYVNFLLYALKLLAELARKR